MNAPDSIHSARDTSVGQAAAPSSGRYPASASWPDGILKSILSGTLLLKIYFVGPLLAALLVGGAIGGISGAGYSVPTPVMWALYAVGTVVGVAAVVLQALSVWRVTPELDDPRNAVRAVDDQPRRALRSVTVVLIALALIGQAVGIIQLALNGIPQPGQVQALTTIDIVAGASTLLSIAGSAVWYAVLAWHLSHLAAAIDLERAQRRASTAIWLWPLLCTVGILFCGLGPIITLVFAYNLVTMLRKALIIEAEALANLDTRSA